MHFITSDPKDVIRNLEWALREQMAWEDRAISPKQLLMQDQSTMGPPSGMSRDDWERARAVAVMNMIDNIVPSVNTSQSSSKESSRTRTSSPSPKNKSKK